MTAEKWRNVSLLACLGVVIGSIGPWETTFIADVSGTQGDGVATLVLGLIAASLVIFFKPEPPKGILLIMAMIAGIACATIGAVDLIRIIDSKQELFGRDVDLVDPGWGIWVMMLAAVALTVAVFKYLRSAGPALAVQAPPPPNSAGKQAEVPGVETGTAGEELPADAVSPPPFPPGPPSD